MPSETASPRASVAAHDRHLAQAIGASSPIGTNATTFPTTRHERRGRQPAAEGTDDRVERDDGDPRRGRTVGQRPERQQRKDDDAGGPGDSSHR